MKILLLGAGGMLGHMTGCFLKEKYGPLVVLAARKPTGYPILDERIEIIDLADKARLKELIVRIRPCTVINCAAVNQPDQGAEVMQEINARLPYTIASILDAMENDSRLIHISTDGVFRGDRGIYDEYDLPDSQDIYGRTKQAGEINRPPHLTIRTSIIGPDPVGSRGLLHWFLSQKSDVEGFSRVFWSGVTTLQLARFMVFAIANNISGLYHLSSKKISKYDLLCLMNDVFVRSVVITKEEKTVLDRSLATRRKDIDYHLPEHRQMMLDLKEWMKSHPSMYDQYLPFKG